MKQQAAFLILAIVPARKCDVDGAEEVVMFQWDERVSTGTFSEESRSLAEARWVAAAFISLATDPDQAKVNVSKFFLQQRVEPHSIELLTVNEAQLRPDLLPDPEVRRKPRMVSKLNPLFVLPDPPTSEVASLKRFCEALFSK